MVTIATALGRTGLQDWLIQRVSAVIMIAYLFFLLTFLWMSPGLTYDKWIAFFGTWYIKIGTLLVILSLIAHAWIGIWTVTTDYIKNMRLRLLIQIFVNMALIGQMIWGVLVVWRV